MTHRPATARAHDMQTNEPKLPPFACARYGQHEHDWLDCPDCIAKYEEMGEPKPIGELARYAMESTREDSLIDKSYINGFNAALKLAEVFIDEELGCFIEHGRAWVADSSLEKWFPFSASRLRAIEWLMGGKYRTIRRRHDGSYRFTNEALNIWADGDTIESIVNCEAWPAFRDCTERAP